MFFDPQGNEFRFSDWLKTYEPYYFLGGPTLRRSITRRQNQTSRLVEDKVCALLQPRTAPLSHDDLVLATAWKIGAIDHVRSDSEGRVVYKQDFSRTLRFKNQFGERDFSEGIRSLAGHMAAIEAQVNQDPAWLLDRDTLPLPLPGFGTVYRLTLLFFITRGKYPIYDKYADIAATAISLGLPPGSSVPYKRIQNWAGYERFMEFLRPLRDGGAGDAAQSRIFISRSVDRALWTYGHFFPTQTAVRGERSSHLLAQRAATIPSTVASQNGVLVGRVRTLSQTTCDGWARREIIVQQDATGYPRIRDSIHLTDSAGGIYPPLKFIKGAHVHGHVCLGKPGALKPWFTERYPFDRVEGDEVYFEPTGRPGEYRLYSASEWAHRSSDGK
ncbi:MAG: hypothetical protein ACYCP0_09290 [Acidiferrobacteraceae bacterium]